MYVGSRFGIRSLSDLVTRKQEKDRTVAENLAEKR